MKHVFPSDLIVVENETAGLRRTLAYLEEHGWCQITARNAFGDAILKAIEIASGMPA
jgi:hypothetical protein